MSKSSKKISKKSSSKTSKKTFKEYYDENPDFRQRHLKRISEKVTCECGTVSTRNNITRHRRSRLHAKRLESSRRIQELNEMKREIERLIIKLNRLSD